MTPPRIDAVLLRWPDQVAYSAIGILSLPDSPAMLLCWAGESPWAALRGLWMQAKAMSVVTAARWN